MPVKIIEKLRLLNPTLAIFMKTKPPPTPKPKPNLFSRVFPHKLKYQSFPKRLLAFPTLNHSQFRTFSTRSDVKASKSLIEDEAELSDWVSDLRSDSFLSNKQSYSDSDDNPDFGRPSRGDFSGKRRRDGGDSHDFGSRRGGFSTRGNRNSFDSRRSSGQFDRKREYGSKDSGMSSRGRGGSMNGGRGGRDFDSGDYGRGGFSRRGRESRDFDSSGYGKGGVSNRGRASRDFEADDYGRGGSSKRGRGGHRDSFDSSSRDSRLGNRGGRGSELGSRGDKGGGRGGMRTGSSVSKRGGLMMSDTDDFDEDEVEDADEGLEKVRGSFRELISEDNSEDDSESVVDDEDDDDASKNASSFSRMEIKDSPSASPTSSQGGSDSYLSETR